jgi:hypothetical protein
MALLAALTACILASTASAQATAEVRVATPEELANAVAQGAQAIVITEHMDTSCGGAVRCDNLTPLKPTLATRSIRV